MLAPAPSSTSLTSCAMSDSPGALDSAGLSSFCCTTSISLCPADLASAILAGLPPHPLLRHPSRLEKPSRRGCWTEALRQVGHGPGSCYSRSIERQGGGRRRCWCCWCCWCIWCITTLVRRVLATGLDGWGAAQSHKGGESEQRTWTRRQDRACRRAGWDRHVVVA